MCCVHVNLVDCSACKVCSVASIQHRAHGMFNAKCLLKSFALHFRPASHALDVAYHLDASYRSGTTSRKKANKSSLLILMHTNNTHQKNPATRNPTRDHLMSATIYSQMLYQLSYSRLALLDKGPVKPTPRYGALEVIQF